MQPFDYLGALRRRWLIIVALAILGGVVAVLIPVSKSPGTAGSSGFLQPRYTAAVILGSSGGGQSGTATVTPQEVLTAVHSGPVEVSTASKLHLTQGASAVGAAVVLSPTGNGSAQLAATAATPQDAANLANAYAASMLSYLAGLNASQQREQTAAASARMDTLQAQLNAVTSKLAPLIAAPSAANAPETAVLQSQRQALQASYQTAYQQYNQLSTEPAPGPGLAVVQPASPTTALAVKAQKRSILDERRVRGPIGLAIGLVLGLLIALLLEQLDQRVAGRRDAEATFGLPVLAEVPRYRLSHSMRDVVVTSAPLSRSAEGYRTLRTVLLAQGTPDGDQFQRTKVVVPALEARSTDRWGDPTETTQLPVARKWPGRSTALVALVCPGSQPTRSVAVANTAAAFAEYGHSVLVATVEPGSSQPGADPLDGDGSAAADRPSAPGDRTRPTKIPGVYRAVVSEVSGASPDTLLSLLSEVESRFDEVIIDTPPAVLTHDAAAVAGLVDQMVLVCQVRWTARGQARRAVELLRRVGAPLLGILLTQSDTGGTRSRRRSEYGKATWTGLPERQPDEAPIATSRAEVSQATPVPDTGRAEVGS
jgi:succinoglycan biosynthesis transport protein ExoP